MIAVALVCGAGVGAGVWMAARGLFPPRPSLAQALAALRQVPGPAPIVAAAEPGGPSARLGGPVAAVLGRYAPGLVFPAVRRDLVVLARSPERHLAEKTTLAILGVLIAPATTAVLTVGGLHLPLMLPVWAALVLGAGGFFVPDLGIRAEATARRGEFRHTLSSFLDLVVIALAGGGGVETALGDAAGIGGGFAFEHLRRALDAARLAREAPWGALGRLGDELGIAELVELAASVALAGTEGAKVRASLAAKAVSLRSHELSEAEGEAQATTEAMSLPVVLLFAGFLVFIGFPAIERVLTGL